MERLAVGLHRHRVGLFRRLEQVHHIVAAVVAEHDLDGHAVVQDRAGIVGVGAGVVLAARLFGADPDVEYAGLFEHGIGEHAERVLVAPWVGQRHGRAVGAAAGEFHDHGLALEGVGHFGYLVGQQFLRFGPQRLGNGGLGLVRQNLPECRSADLLAVCIEAIHQPTHGAFGGGSVLVHEVIVVLVEQFHEGAPI